MSNSTNKIFRAKISLILAAGLLFVLVYHAKAQEPAISPAQPEKIVETLEQHAESSDAEFDYTDLFAELEFFLANPLPINTSTFDEIRQLFFLNDIQVNNLLKYISEYGKIASLFELSYIEGFDREVIDMLAPYITLRDDVKQVPITPRRALQYGKNQLFVRYGQVLETQKGFSPIDDSLLQLNPNQRYLGSPYRLYTRYAYNYRNRLRWGFTAEKDPGEEFFKGSQKYGFDFFSGYVYYKGDKLIREVILGDYQIQCGQGLTLWTSYSFGKSSDVSGIRKVARGIRPNTSANENQFLRGSAITLGFKRFTLTAFGSHKKNDATVMLTDSIDAEVLEVSALQYTGLHRTPRELENRRSVSETLFGGRAGYTGSRFQAGVTFYNMNLGARLEPSQQLYNKYYFRGRQNHVLGADVLYLFRGGQVFGEVSGSASGGVALMAGSSLFPSPRLVLSGVYRRFDKNYQNLYNAPFAESSNAAGEEGLFVGMLFLISSRVTFTGYVDHFRFRWLRYRVDAPSRGKEYTGEFTYNPTRYVEMRLRYRYKQREQNVSGNERITIPQSYEKQSIRFHIGYNASRELSLRNRVEWVISSGNQRNIRNGYMMYQDVIWRPSANRWSLTARYALFDTDTYDERIYAYENDVLYAFSVPAYYYKGSRAYMLLRYQASRKLDFWLRIGQTWYANTSSIGSGLDEITGNTRTEIKAQVRIKF